MTNAWFRDAVDRHRAASDARTARLLGFAPPEQPPEHEPRLPDVAPDFTAGGDTRIAPDAERLFHAELEGAAVEARERRRWLGGAYDRPKHNG